MPKKVEKTALGHEIKKHRKVKPKMWKTAQSLKPTAQLVNLLLLPNPSERVEAMRDAWAFRFPVTVLKPGERLENDPQVIFAPDHVTSRGRHKKLTPEQAEQLVGDDGSVDFDYDSI